MLEQYILNNLGLWLASWVLVQIWLIWRVLALKKHSLLSSSKLHQENVGLRQEVLGLHAALQANDAKILALDEKIMAVANTKDANELRTAPVTSYRHAAKMVAKGCDESELVASFGLNTGEAQLLKILYTK